MLLTPFYRWRNWLTQRLSHWEQSRHPVGAGAESLRTAQLPGTFQPQTHCGLSTSARRGPFGRSLSGQETPTSWKSLSPGVAQAMRWFCWRIFQKIPGRITAPHLQNHSLLLQRARLAQMMEGRCGVSFILLLAYFFFLPSFKMTVSIT